ncbi:MAG: LacI family DNA-binding transcriptional regulator, partial [Phycisphaeraceae bacterium]
SSVFTGAEKGASMDAQVKQPRVRLKDVARKARLSVSAVSMALADHPSISAESKRRVVRICRELGYTKPGAGSPSHPQAYLQGRKIGFMIVGNRFDDESYAPLLHSAAVQAQAVGARVEIGAAESRAPQAAVRPTMALADRVDGLILIGHVDRALLTHLAELETPMIVLGSVLTEPTEPPPNVASVGPDDLEMGRLATAVLLAHGHERVAYICEMLPPGLSHHQWLMGYRLAHLERGAPLDPALVHVAGEARAGGAPAAAHFAAMAQPPTAVVVPDVPLARSFVDAYSRHGHRLASDALVCGGYPDRARTYGMASYGMVHCEPDRLLATAIDLLKRKMRGDDVAHLSIRLHPRCINLPTKPRE